ncbi:MAG: hypothetical protein LBN39_03630, partial [Planctomycetaceae bacterium]|nr:hypothetical protein [Planctomycetaceae bacterium]
MRYFLPLTLFFFLLFASPVPMTAAEEVKSSESELRGMLETIEKNTPRKLPTGLGQKRLDKKDLEAARTVFDTSEKILANDNITDEFRIWTLKRKAHALIQLAYEETPKHFPLLADVINDLEGKENSGEILHEAESHLLIIGIQIAA